MSDGSSSVLGEARNDMRMALITVGISLGMLLVFYYLSGQRMLRSEHLAEETRVAQQQADEKIRSNEALVQDIQSQLSSVRQSLSREEMNLAEAQTLKDRLTEIEQALSQMPNLTDNVRMELDQMAARRARSRAELVSVGALLTQCDKALERMSELTHTWQSDYSLILQDDRGRRIASDPAALAQVSTVFMEVLPTSDDCNAWLRELAELSRPIRAAVASEADYQVQPSDRTYVEGLLTRVESANQRLAARQGIIERYLALSSQRPVAERTLEQALQTAEQEALAELVVQATEKRVEALRATVEEHSEVIRQAEEERILAATQVRTAELAAEKAGLLQRERELQASLEAAAAAAARRQLEADFKRDEAEIRTLLAPFLADSESQPALGKADDPTSWIIPGVPFGPVSFGRLQGSGALDETDEGRHRLYYFAGYAHNFRPKRGFPEYSRTGLSNQGVARRVDRARELLLKYGPLMVEQRMLQR
jgi:hypothetical protein